MGKGHYRNKLCFCNSGRKYKNCCINKKTTPKDLKMGKEMKDIFKGTKVKKCFFASEGGCSSKIINAHSIQNNRVLNKISKNGNVVGLDFDFTNVSAESSGVGFGVMGRKQSSVFNGLCSDHDTQLFQSIDNNDFIPGNIEQEFYFALRALVCEFWKKVKAVKMLEGLKDKKEIDKRMLDVFIEVNSGPLEYLEYYLDLFKKSHKEKSYDLLQTVIIELDEEYPIAVNSAISLEVDAEGNQINNLEEQSVNNERVKIVFLNIFPQDGKTIAVLSWLKEDEELFEGFKGQLEGLSDKNEKLNLLNNIIALYTENFFMNPDAFDEMGEEEKKAFSDLFMGTFEGSNPDTPLLSEPDFDLFRAE